MDKTNSLQTSSKYKDLLPHSWQEEATATLEAIRFGEVDALVVLSEDGSNTIHTIFGAEHPYQIMIEQMEEGAFTLSEDGAILYNNSRFAAMLQTRPERVLGSSIYRYVAWKSREPLEAFLKACFEGVSGRLEITLCPNASGAKHPTSLLLSATLLTLTNSEPVVSIVASDITARKQAEAAIHQLNAELEVRVKERTAQLEAALREMEAFSYTISHDLRAPLRAIHGFTALLSEEVQEGMSPDAEFYLKTVCENAERMGQMIDDLLSFSRFSRQVPTIIECPMGEMIRQVVTDLRSEMRHREVTIHIEPDLPDCQGDPALLRQVLFNLMSNALKYTAPRETAQITIGSLPERDNNEVIYFIQDNGVGFDMQYAHKLFGVFQRLHRAEDFEGTGVGLAIVQRIIHRHGGRIWAVGIPDGGATFYFTLEKSLTPSSTAHPPELALAA